jgi:hypothetical protein
MRRRSSLAGSIVFGEAHDDQKRSTFVVNATSRLFDVQEVT